MIKKSLIVRQLRYFQQGAWTLHVKIIRLTIWFPLERQLQLGRKTEPSSPHATVQVPTERVKPIWLQSLGLWTPRGTMLLPQWLAANWPSQQHTESRTLSTLTRLKTDQLPQEDTSGVMLRARKSSTAWISTNSLITGLELVLLATLPSARWVALITPQMSQCWRNIGTNN